MLEIQRWLYAEAGGQLKSFASGIDPLTLLTSISIAAHAIAEEVRHQLLHHLKYLSLVVIHVDPEEKSGEQHHRIEKHAHDGLPAHSHAA